MAKKPYYSWLFVAFIVCQHAWAQNPVVDSLQALLKKTTVDTVRLQLYTDLFWELRNNDDLKAMEFAKQGLKEAQKFPISETAPRYFYYWQSVMMLTYATALSDLSEYDKAITIAKEALVLNNKINDKKEVAKTLNNIGEYHRMKGEYQTAIGYYVKSLKIKEERKDKKGMGTSYSNIGLCYYSMNRYKEALENMNRSLQLRKEVNHKRGIADIYGNLGLVYLQLKDYEKAKECYLLSLTAQQEVGNSTGVANALFNLGEYFSYLHEYKESKKYYVKADSIFESVHSPAEIAYGKMALASISSFLGDHQAAITYGKKGIGLGRQYRLNRELGDWYNTMSEIYKGAKDYVNALEAKNLSVVYTDSVINESTNRSITNLKLFYESEQKDAQIKLQAADITAKESDLKRQKLQTIFLVAIIVFILFFLTLMYRMFAQKKKANKIITEQKHIVEEKQKEILDSINYAKRIQFTLLAHDEFLSQHLPDHFVFFHPKDIVSGDFYWATAVASKQLAVGSTQGASSSSQTQTATANSELFYLAVCDSTGHGVPGAFMSLLNIGFLTEAINEKNIQEPHLVLEHVRQRLIDNISKEGQKDGFDGVLICIDKKNNKITYSAANNAPLLVSNTTVTELKADPMPVGLGERKEQFSCHEIQYTKNDMLYLYTDGYADQFGGPRGKKLMYKRLFEKLLQVSSLSSKEQYNHLKNGFEEWRGELEQVDDVCVIGIRL
jgi:serine phosphatase RsbU (regulator of sigma subunit)/Tfp pilus assembly protein PilF